MNLPKLSDKEEYDLLLQYKIIPTQEAKTKLVLNTLRMIRPFISKFEYKIREDLINEASAAICAALDRIVPREGCKFSTYAYMSAKKYVCIYASIEYEMNTNEYSNLEELDIISEEDNTDIEALYEALDKLTTQDQMIIYELYFKGSNRTQCALSMGHTCRNFAAKHEKRILEQLRGIL